MALSTKPRWDKYDGYVGNFRGPLAADVVLATEANRVLAVGVNNNGAITKGFGASGIKGLVIVPVGLDMSGNLLDGGINTEAGDICDVGVAGEITNFKTTATDGTQADAVAGTNYYGHADGSVTATKGTDGVYVGHTVEKTRLIVHVNTFGKVGVADLATTGVAGPTTYLRGDGAWTVNAP
jgi:hypothetical protein